MLVVAAACGGDDGDDTAADPFGDGDARAALAPAFGPTTSSTVTSSGPTTIVLGGTDAVPDAATATTAAPMDPSAAIDDLAGDVTAADGAPAWADVLGARVTLSSPGYELRIRLAGGAAPDRSPDANTMNVASFFDLNGDGVIDHEIWANLGPDGWGASYYDNRTGEARHGERSFVTVAPEGDEVVIRFSRVHLEEDEEFRWSVASEWGPLLSIGTESMARDQAPDAGAAAAFPA